MNIIFKDILTVDSGIIVHQVNTLGVMGAGLARDIRNKWPVVYRVYLAHKDISSLGKAQMIKIDKNLYVCNVFAQDRVGKGFNTRYWALERGFQHLMNYITQNNIKLTVYVPYKIGCGLGGGDWNIVSKIIDQQLPDAIVCKL